MFDARVLAEEWEQVGGCWAAPGIRGYDPEDPPVVDRKKPVRVDLRGLGSGCFLRQEWFTFCGLHVGGHDESWCELADDAPVFACFEASSKNMERSLNPSSILCRYGFRNGL